MGGIWIGGGAIIIYGVCFVFENCFASLLCIKDCMKPIYAMSLGKFTLDLGDYPYGLVRRQIYYDGFRSIESHAILREATYL